MYGSLPEPTVSLDLSGTPLPTAMTLAAKEEQRYRISLQTAIVVSLVVQVLAAVGIAGWLAMRNGQRAVADAVTQKRQETAARVELKLQQYLTTPHIINQLNADVLRVGMLNLRDLRWVERLFFQQIELFPTVSYIALGTERGEYVGVERQDDGSFQIKVAGTATGGALVAYAAEPGGKRGRKLSSKSGYRPQERPWYRAPLHAGRPTWSPIYSFFLTPKLAISAGLPLYASNGKPIGAIATDLVLSQLDAYLHEVAAANGERAYIIERSGNLVASSVTTPARALAQLQGKRLHAMHSEDEIIRTTMVQIQQEYPRWQAIDTSLPFEIWLDRERYFLQIVPLRDGKGIDWLLVVALPESNFSGLIADNQRSTVFLCLVAFIFAVGVGVFTSRWIARPMLRLSAAATTLAGGRWNEPIPNNSPIAEVSVLSRAFTHMATQLQETFASLEQRGAMLAEAQKLANVGSWQLDTIAGTATWSAELFRLFGVVPDALVSPQLQDYLERIVEADRPAVEAAIARLLHSGQPYAFDHRIARIDGSTRYVAARGMPLWDATGQRIVGMLGTVLDITDRKAAEDALQQAETKFRTMFEHAIEGMFQSTADPEGRLLSANPALARMLGYDSPEAAIAEIATIRGQLYVEPQARDRLVSALLEAGIVREYVSQIRRRDGTIIWIAESTRTVRDEAGNVAYFEGAVEDITERRRSEDMVRYQATHDLLTDLPNRTLFNARLQAAIASAADGDRALAVLFLDLDRFKTINDSLGHSTGDRLLQAVAQRLTAAAGEASTVSRWGGDEFTLLLPQVPHVDAALGMAEQILQALQPPFVLDGQHLRVTASIGLALFPHDGRDGDTLIKNADTALYYAKARGRDRCQAYDRPMNETASSLLALENDLYGALERDEFEVFYQPKISAVTGSIVGMEALLRWQHPRLGTISPLTFIPLAEESGLIVPLSTWVLTSACAQNLQWQQEGLGQLPIAINISARQFLQPELASTMLQTIRHFGVLPHLLELEITESLAMQDVEYSKRLLWELYGEGVRVTIDDFGTGYSSLSYLKNFPLHSIKVDKCFVREVDTDPYDRAILSAIVALAKGLGLTVVAEGVETEVQLSCLRAIGCDVLQGYLFGYPASAAETTQLLRARRTRASAV